MTLFIDDPVAFDDYMWGLEISARLGALQTRKVGEGQTAVAIESCRRTDTTHECSVCGELVAIIEDLVPFMGIRHVWRHRTAEAHSRACFEERERRAVADDSPSIDLWQQPDLYPTK